MTETYDPDDPWNKVYTDLGYQWCRSCSEWHRPPECPIDQDGNPNPVWSDGGA